MGISTHNSPSVDYHANYWLCTITIDPELKIKGQENAYKDVIKTAVGGAAGVIHAVDCASTNCQPNYNVEALRVYMQDAKIEARPLWKPMHRQPVYCIGAVETAPGIWEDPKMNAYVNGVSESLFKVGMCLPAGSYVTDADVSYIVECIK